MMKGASTMNKRFMAFALTFATASAVLAAPQVVENSISMSQDAATGRVTVSYDLPNVLPEGANIPPEISLFTVFLKERVAPW